jgi:hypothetical protein
MAESHIDALILAARILAGKGPRLCLAGALSGSLEQNAHSRPLLLKGRLCCLWSYQLCRLLPVIEWQRRLDDAQTGTLQQHEVPLHSHSNLPRSYPVGRTTGRRLEALTSKVEGLGWGQSL